MRTCLEDVFGGRVWRTCCEDVFADVERLCVWSRFSCQENPIFLVTVWREAAGSLSSSALLEEGGSMSRPPEPEDCCTVMRFGWCIVRGLNAFS